MWIHWEIVYCVYICGKHVQVFVKCERFFYAYLIKYVCETFHLYLCFHFVFDLLKIHPPNYWTLLCSEHFFGPKGVPLYRILLYRDKNTFKKIKIALFIKHIICGFIHIVSWYVEVFVGYVWCTSLCYSEWLLLIQILQIQVCVSFIIMINLQNGKTTIEHQDWSSCPVIAVIVDSCSWGSYHDREL